VKIHSQIHRKVSSSGNDNVKLKFDQTRHTSTKRVCAQSEETATGTIIRPRLLASGVLLLYSDQRIAARPQRRVGDVSVHGGRTAPPSPHWQLDESYTDESTTMTSHLVHESKKYTAIWGTTLKLNGLFSLSRRTFSSYLMKIHTQISRNPDLKEQVGQGRITDSEHFITSLLCRGHKSTACTVVSKHPVNVLTLLLQSFQVSTKHHKHNDITLVGKWYSHVG